MPWGRQFSELGYHGHIHMLIGMSTQGRNTGVIMDRNTEPYGDISINKPDFPLQFKGKSIRDRFEVGQDVDSDVAGHDLGASRGP